MNACPPPEWDLLLSACQKNDPALVRSLLEGEQEVDPSHANRVGQSALHVASLWGHEECVRILLTAGANVNAQNSITGATPLHCTVQSSKGTRAQRLAVVQLLLKGGANASMGDNYGSMAFDYCEEGDEVLRDMLTPQKPPIFEALEENGGDVASIESLLKQDSSLINARYLSQTPLLNVVERLLNSNDDDDDGDKQLQILTMLLHNGADPNDSSTANRNGHLEPQEARDDLPLHQLCLGIKKQDSSSSTLKEAAKLCKDHGASVSKETQLLLHDAARRGNIAMINFLLRDLEININTKGRQGMTALHFAARSGKTDTVVHLLEQYGPDISQQNDAGRTALDAAVSNNREEIVTLLKEHEEAK